MSEMDDITSYCTTLAKSARAAARALATLPGQVRNQAVRGIAELVRRRQTEILAANERDVSTAAENGLSNAQLDRLKLNPARLESMATAAQDIAALPDPVGRIIESNVRPNGLEVQKVRVPLGVVFFIYESRPNVTTDAAALCLKSGNAVILRGGKEALRSNRALVEIVQAALDTAGAPRQAVQLVATTDRQAVGVLLQQSDHIDVAIPRGGEELIRRVAAEARMPVLKHYKGVCHVYIDKDADLAMALAITENAKCQRPGVCNAAETLLVHQAVAESHLPALAHRLRERGVELRGCARTCELVSGCRPATAADYFAEYLDLILAVRVVDDLEEAVAHVARYGSAHTEAIVTNSYQAARRFVAAVDSSAVMVNASTRFNDGGEFGLGAEIGISTDKFHARGPCGLNELTTYKYVVYGTGQVRR